MWGEPETPSTTSVLSTASKSRSAKFGPTILRSCSACCRFTRNSPAAAVPVIPIPATINSSCPVETRTTKTTSTGDYTFTLRAGQYILGQPLNSRNGALLSGCALSVSCIPRSLIRRRAKTLCRAALRSKLSIDKSHSSTRPWRRAHWLCWRGSSAIESWTITEPFSTPKPGV